MDDLAHNVQFEEIRNELLNEILKDWDPEWVMGEMAAKRKDQDILSSWGKQIQPPDQYRWPLLSGMDYLEPG